MATVGSVPGDDYTTIQAAMTGEASGATLQIRNETFAEGDLTAAAKFFLLRSHPDNPAGTRWLVDATGYATGIKVSLAGWDIRDGEVANATGAGITTTGANLRYGAKNCYVHDCGGNGIEKFDNQGATIIDQCIVANCGGYGIYSTPDDARVHNCIVYDCVGYGIWAGSSAPNPGRVLGCTVAGITGAPGHGIYSGLTNILIRDCIAYACAGDGINVQNGGVGGNVYGSVGHANLGTNINVATQTGCSVADPLLTNPAALDFNIGAASPARRLGSVATGLTYDQAGNARPTPVTGDYDAGALQFVQTDSGIDSITVEDAETVLVEFVDDGAPTVPVQASAENVANLGLTGDYDIDVATSTRVSDFSYRMTLSRPTVLAEALTLDTSAVATAGGGHCDTPGTLGFVGVQYPNALLHYAVARSSRRVEVHLDTAPWYSPVARGSATNPLRWVVRLKGGGAEIAIESVQRISATVYELQLADDLSSTLFEVVGDAVLTDDGGTA